MQLHRLHRFKAGPVHWAYLTCLDEGVATILCCAKLVFMLFTIILSHMEDDNTKYFVLLGK